jgi:hypothetical protein
MAKRVLRMDPLEVKGRVPSAQVQRYVFEPVELIAHAPGQQATTQVVEAYVAAAAAEALSSAYVPSPVADVSPELRKGSAGDPVRHLQNLLTAAGYDVGEVDGIFGERTEAAVKSFQRDNGLTADGIVSPRTWAKVQGEIPYAIPPRGGQVLAETLKATPPVTPPEGQEQPAGRAPPAPITEEEVRELLKDLRSQFSTISRERSLVPEASAPAALKALGVFAGKIPDQHLIRLGLHLRELDRDIDELSRHLDFLEARLKDLAAADPVEQRARLTDVAAGIPIASAMSFVTLLETAHLITMSAAVQQGAPPAYVFGMLTNLSLDAWPVRAAWKSEDAEALAVWGALEAQLPALQGRARELNQFARKVRLGDRISRTVTTFLDAFMLAASVRPGSGVPRPPALVAATAGAAGARVLLTAQYLERLRRLIAVGALDPAVVVLGPRAVQGFQPSVGTPLGAPMAAQKAGKASPAKGGAAGAGATPQPPAHMRNLVRQLERRFPKLKGHLSVVYRHLHSPGLYDEAQRTGTGRWTFMGRFRDGKPVQIDGFADDGRLLDVKMADTGRQYRAVEQEAERRTLDVVQMLRGETPRAFEQSNLDLLVRERIGRNLARQARFIRENGLPGGLWHTNSHRIKRLIQEEIKNYELKGFSVEVEP